MAGALLGDTFDIHGGGIDLDLPAPRERDRPVALRPRHAASWPTTGCTTASSRSRARRCRRALGNFVTIHELLDSGDSAIDMAGRGAALRHARDALSSADRLDSERLSTKPTQTLVDTGSDASARHEPRCSSMLPTKSSSALCRRPRTLRRSRIQRRCTSSHAAAATRLTCRGAKLRSPGVSLRAMRSQPAAICVLAAGRRDVESAAEPTVETSASERDRSTHRRPRRRPQGQELRRGGPHPRRTRRHGHRA